MTTLAEGVPTISENEKVKRPSGGDPASPVVVAAKSLCHTFPSRRAGDPPQQVLRNITLDVRRGEFVAIVGPSGCGKSTFLNLAAGLEALQSPNLFVNGAAPRAGTLGVGYMFARDALVPWRTAVRNVELALEFTDVPKRERRPRALEALARVGLSDYADSYRAELSQGMRQRVALARTLVAKPTLLFMDEPYSALDSQTRMKLQEELSSLVSEEALTILFITHDLGEAIALADRVVLLSGRPGTIKQIIDIQWPRPRSIRSLQADPKFHELYEELWTQFQADLAPEETEASQ